MIRTLALAALLIATGALAPVAAGQPATPAAVTAMRNRIEARYEIVPLRDAIGLRPKQRSSRLRLIEISDGTIAIDGATVTGRELRDAVGADADAIVALSYYDAAARRAFLGQATEAPSEPPREQPVPDRSTPDRSVPDRSVPDRATPDRSAEPSARAPDVRRRRVGERVHVFGDVTVRRDEQVDGQVVAVLGSVRIDGRVTDQVVAVMGSVHLGPDSEVDGDVIAVGGRIEMADGAHVNGHVREVSLRSSDGRWSGNPAWAAPFVFNPFSGAARLFGTVFRLFLLGLFTSVVVLLARQPIERIGHRASAEPLKMAMIGVLAQLLFLPALVLTAVILAVTIIGIPLLLLLPFAVLAMLLVFLGGFTGVAYAVGGWGAERAGWPQDQPFLRVWLGVLIVLIPILVARLIGIAGGPFRIFAVMITIAAFLVEYLAWTTGFGAALTTAYEQWRSRRAMPA
jgi:hypothetical protein